MIKSLFKYIPFFLFITLVGCSSNPKNVSTYFGGKIINPKSKYVILYSTEEVLDTLILDENNKFFGKLDNAKEGLYYFIHGKENQYIYLEPQDSLMLRLNTWDFDESLVFAGKGAERNNILIDCFLEDEKDEKNFYIFNNLDPDKFKWKIDSLINTKLITYNHYIENHTDETEGYRDLLKVALTYPLFARAERYPIMYVKHSNTKEFPEIKNSFYAYRETLDFNNDSLMYYAPYTTYVRNYLYNVTYSLGHKPMTNEYSSNFTVDLLKTIDTKISSEKSKNAFLKQTVLGHFYRKSSCNVNQNAFETFFDLSSNKEDKSIIKKLLADNKSLHKGNKIPDFSIIDFNKTRHSIKEIITDKNTFLFFWNPEFVSKEYISSRVGFLSNKFPEIQFIQVKINGSKNDKIDQLDIKNQFFIDTKNKDNSFLTSKMPRVILINKKGIVENGYASISSKNIHSQLKKLSEK